MSAFTSVLAGLVVAWRSPATTTADDLARYRAIIETLAAEAAADPLWGIPEASDEPGPHVAATTTMLLAVAYHESGLREEVRRCTIDKRGRYAGLFQLARGWTWQGHARDEICASDALQTQLALAVLKSYRDRGSSTTPSFWVNGFASGDGGKTSREARDIRALWVAFSRRVGLDVFTSSRHEPRWSPRGRPKPAVE
jgi:hypothetical protein